MLSLADDDTMTIVALSDTTIRLLGSPQVLTTPTSLVKELVDNALDAKAMSIDITISPNTLDRLEVRDNGHGNHSFHDY
jgi:DNA mismatch repair ATPase MutL